MPTKSHHHHHHQFVVPGRYQCRLSLDDMRCRKGLGARMPMAILLPCRLMFTDPSSFHWHWGLGSVMPDMPDTRSSQSCIVIRLDQVADELSPASTKAVLLKLHVADPPHEDLLRSLHAIAMEVMESRWHCFILLQVRPPAPGRLSPQLCPQHVRCGLGRLQCWLLHL